MPEDKNKGRGEGQDKGKRSDEGRNRRENVPPKSQMQYDEGVVTKILTRGDFNSWREVINWLDFNADQDNELNAREAKAAMTDFKRLEQEGAPFSKDPNQLMQTIHQYKGQGGPGQSGRGQGGQGQSGRGRGGQGQGGQDLSGQG